MPRARLENIQEEKKRPSLRMRLLMGLLNIIILSVVILAGYVAVVFLRMPSLDDILHETRPAAIVFLDRNGNEIRSAGRIMGMPVSTDSVPPHVWQAIVAIEDKRFFQHGPVDIRGIMRAVISNIVHGRVAAGGLIYNTADGKKCFPIAREKAVPQGTRADFIILA